MYSSISWSTTIVSTRTASAVGTFTEVDVTRGPNEVSTSNVSPGTKLSINPMRCEASNGDTLVDVLIIYPLPAVVMVALNGGAATPNVGDSVGCCDIGDTLGEEETGSCVGLDDGAFDVGIDVGTAVGVDVDGEVVGDVDGVDEVGLFEGVAVGMLDGVCVGFEEG